MTSMIQMGLDIPPVITYWFRVQLFEGGFESYDPINQERLFLTGLIDQISFVNGSTQIFLKLG